MSEKRFRVCCDDDLGDMWVVDIVTDEEYWTAPSLVDVLNNLAEENEQLEGKLERKETLLKIRTEDNEKIMKSIHQLIIYLENSVYKSDVSAIAVKKDIISLIKKWEVR